MLNKVYASIDTSCPSNSTNPYVISSPIPPITPPTSYNNSNISSPKLCMSPVHHPPQPLNEPHTSSLPSLKRVPTPASSITATTTFGRNFITKPTTPHLLPSLLLPQASYPLISLCHSIPSNQLPPWVFVLALKRTLRLNYSTHLTNLLPVRTSTRPVWRSHLPM
jgi:hypothetical protein